MLAAQRALFLNIGQNLFFFRRSESSIRERRWHYCLLKFICLQALPKPSFIDGRPSHHSSFSTLATSILSRAVLSSKKLFSVHHCDSHIKS